ncbi:sodium:solute symporter family protein [Pseudonocardia acaciae]|uniref:sodium:solute symporter family protein n=1 Tax=Pseudonocardia acaciae TaxID=551276 RepID=UPI0006844A6D|nr:sodium:solute symporter family protein [Pseudonocardia acaciae]
MNILIGYGAVALFMALVVGVLQLTRRPDVTFVDYATAGRSFGSWFQTMSFLNTWIAGTGFISFAGLAVSGGVIGYYSMLYSLLGVVMMFFLADRVSTWGRRLDLRTQSDLLGTRYRSMAVRRLAAGIGVLAGIPWLVLGMQSLGMVFSYLSFGHVSPGGAILVGIGVLVLRQVWTVRMGMRGVVISDMVQGIVAYGVGLVVIVAMIVWLVRGGHSLDAVAPEKFLLPLPGSAEGGWYLFSLLLTGFLGAWCWPDIFVRLFTARGVWTIKRSAVQAAPLMLLFTGALTTLALLASSLPEVAAKPDHVWFLLLSHGGPVLLALGGVIVIAATMGNVDGAIQAVSAQVANDILGSRSAELRTARLAAVVMTAVGAVGAASTTASVEGLIGWAILSYQVIVQLAPALFLGVFWRRGGAAAALCGMASGIAVAGVLQMAYPVSVPWLGGLTSGVAGLIVNTAAYLAVACARPMPVQEAS